mmetsp:Transcript_61684/g.163391  ORF Transcript_61684/g.163391 Transcript_61684/m.163391 type:complete len:207 (-) Transcript_61684:391-1011(-)
MSLVETRCPTPVSTPTWRALPSAMSTAAKSSMGRGVASSTTSLEASSRVTCFSRAAATTSRIELRAALSSPRAAALASAALASAARVSTSRSSLVPSHLSVASPSKVGSFSSARSAFCAAIRLSIGTPAAAPSAQAFARSSRDAAHGSSSAWSRVACREAVALAFSSSLASLPRAKSRCMIPTDAALASSNTACSASAERERGVWA